MPTEINKLWVGKGLQRFLRELQFSRGFTHNAPEGTTHKEGTALSAQESLQVSLEDQWQIEGVWYRSKFIKEFLRRARSEYPTPRKGDKAAWPEDEEGIAQNLTYFFTGHLLKINKILCSLLRNDEALTYLSTARDLTVIDMACGAGMASVGFIDFLVQAISTGAVERRGPLTIDFVLNDLNGPCVNAAERSVKLAGEILRERNIDIHIGCIHGYTGSVSGIVPLISMIHARPFDLLFFCNAFDHVLMYGHKALEKDPSCTDPIAYARPCDRPAHLAELFHQLGAHANPYFTRVILMQESRHSHLISVALPTRNLKVTQTWMTRETDRPDVETPTMNVRFGYCGCRYGYSSTNRTMDLQPLADEVTEEIRASCSELDPKVGTE